MLVLTENLDVQIMHRHCVARGRYKRCIICRFVL